MSQVLKQDTSVLLNSTSTNRQLLRPTPPTPAYALQLDGVDDYVNCGTGTATLLGNGCTNFSISFWFKADTTSTNDGLFMIQTLSSPGTYALAFFIISNNIYTYSATSTTISFGATTSFTDTTSWHHMMLTYDGTTAKRWIDGVLATVVTTTSVDFSGLETLFGVYHSAPYTFYGKLDEIGIWNKTLSDNDASDLYNSGTGLYIDPTSNFPTDGTSMGTNLVGLWHLDEGSGTSASDSSGNGNTGTLTNMEEADWVAGKVQQ